MGYIYPCEADDCNRRGTKWQQCGMRLCRMHYKRWQRHKDIYHVERRYYVDWKPIIIDEHTVEIPLTRGYKSIIDIEDLDRVIKYNWYAIVSNNNYIRAQTDIGNGNIVYLHRFIMNAKTDEEIDHINRKSLDNRKKNLRVIPHLENMRNTDRHENRIGVSFNIRAKLWMAYLDEPDKKRIYLGYRKTKEEALELVEAAR